VEWSGVGWGGGADPDPNSTRTLAFDPAQEMLTMTPVSGFQQPTKFAYSTPHDALHAWVDAITPIERTEIVSLSKADGRVLAQEIRSDRPNPPCSVSAMDGYVFRKSDLKPGRINSAGEVRIGEAPPPLLAGSTMRIFTGSPVPSEGEVVIKREDVEEHDDDYIIIPESIASSVRQGENIRFRGENLDENEIVLQNGYPVSMPVAGSLAGFGCAELNVFARLRVAVLTTGDELRSVEDAEIDPWQIRNSNGPALANFLNQIPWINLTAIKYIPDDYKVTCRTICGALDENDAVVLTGGVSMGDHDYVPEAVVEAGGRTIFHKIPVRPGKPMLAAVGAQGQVIAGLPGNPVSVMVAMRRTSMPAMRKRAGFTRPELPRALVFLTRPIEKPLNLWWYRPVRLVDTGLAEIANIKGSGDFAATAQSDGFVEIKPNETHPGPWPYWSWSSP